ncbi:hypothetical protein AC630_24655 [Bradyrhizobium sp. AS23.2]|nr:hypothetical protein AC630_24655 [Bradyrhizobium sp. AS23.2]
MSHSGSIKGAPIAADEPQALIVDIPEASPRTDVGAAQSHDDADVAAAVPVAVDQTAVPDAEESVSAAPSAISANEDSSREVPTSVDPVAIEQSSIISVEVEREPVEIADHIFSSDASPRRGRRR